MIVVQWPLFGYLGDLRKFANTVITKSTPRRTTSRECLQKSSCTQSQSAPASDVVGATKDPKIMAFPSLRLSNSDFSTAKRRWVVLIRSSTPSQQWKNTFCDAYLGQKSNPSLLFL